MPLLITAMPASEVDPCPVSAKLNLLNILQKSISIMAPLTHRARAVLCDYDHHPSSSVLVRCGMEGDGWQAEAVLSVCVWFAAAGTHPQSSAGTSSL